MTEKKDETMREIVFYCKDCSELVDADKVGGKYVYKCKKCGTKNVAFGTKKSIANFFHVTDTPKVPSVELPENASIEQKV